MKEINAKSNYIANNSQLVVDLFASCVRLSRLLVGFQMHLKSMHFRFISLACGLLRQLLALSEYHIHQLTNRQRRFDAVGLVYAQKVSSACCVDFVKVFRPS